jgi:hypothetical protein
MGHSVPYLREPASCEVQRLMLVRNSLEGVNLSHLTSPSFSHTPPHFHNPCKFGPCRLDFPVKLVKHHALFLASKLLAFI